MERPKTVFKKTVFVCPTKCYSTHYWNLEKLNLERLADSGDDFCDVTNNTVPHISKYNMWCMFYLFLIFIFFIFDFFITATYR
jgi:hypothetical protein